MRSITTDKIEFTIRGIKYTWGGSFGCILESYERGLKEGSTRVIGNTIFYVYSTYGRRVSWTVPNVTIEFIKEFKESLV